MLLKRGIEVRLDAKRGKGSHQTLYYGSAFTILRNAKDELKTGTLHTACARSSEFALPTCEQKQKAMVERFEYAVKLTPADEGGFVVTCRDLPQLITQGDDKAEALSEAADAMDEVFAAYMQDGLAFPAPFSWRNGSASTRRRCGACSTRTIFQAAAHRAGDCRARPAAGDRPATAAPTPPPAAHCATPCSPDASADQSAEAIRTAVAAGR